MTRVDTAKLRELRRRAGLTLEDVAKLLDYKTPVGYHYVETGECKLTVERAVVLASRDPRSESGRSFFTPRRYHGGNR